MKATAPTPHPTLPSPAHAGDYVTKAGANTRPAWTGNNFEDVAVHEAKSLAPGDLVAGPAIIESDFTTIVVTSQRNAQVDGANNIVLVTK